MEKDTTTAAAATTTNETVWLALDGAGQPWIGTGSSAAEERAGVLVWHLSPEAASEAAEIMSNPRVRALMAAAADRDWATGEATAAATAADNALVELLDEAVVMTAEEWAEAAGIDLDASADGVLDDAAAEGILIRGGHDAVAEWLQEAAR